MARPLTLPERLQVRLPPGTLARVDAACGTEKARKDWVRELIIDALRKAQQAPKGNEP